MPWRRNAVRRCRIGEIDSRSLRRCPRHFGTGGADVV